MFIKLRETYDLATVRNRMSLITIHTPRPALLKKAYPGLLLNHKFYRPVSADITMACASVLPADPLQVGQVEGDVAPEDLFNPILYKACSNDSMSIIDGLVMRNAQNITGTGVDVSGKTLNVDTDSVTPFADDFAIYYSLLADTHNWRHANPQAGMSMTNLRPLVYEVMSNTGVGSWNGDGSPNYLDNAWMKEVIANVNENNTHTTVTSQIFRGNAHALPRLPVTVYNSASNDSQSTNFETGFAGSERNWQITIPAPSIAVGCIIIPPSRLHELYYRMVCEWTVELSEPCTISEKSTWQGMQDFGNSTHYKNYDYTVSKALKGESTDTALTSDTNLVSANVELTKVM